MIGKKNINRHKIKQSIFKKYKETIYTNSKEKTIQAASAAPAPV